MWVTMINSVGEYVAGERYNLKQEEGARFVQLGYAEGELPDGVAPLNDEDAHQVVSLDGG